MSQDPELRPKVESEKGWEPENTYYIAVTNPMPCTIGKVMAGLVAPLGTRLAFAENSVKVSVVNDIPLLELARCPEYHGSRLTGPAPLQRRSEIGSRSD